LPTEKLTVCAYQHLFDTAGQIPVDALNESGGIFPAKGFTLSQFTQEVFSSFIDEPQDGAVSFFAPVLGVMALAGALLISVDGLNGGVQTYMDPTIIIPALLPNPLTHHRHDIEQ